MYEEIEMRDKFGNVGLLKVNVIYHGLEHEQYFQGCGRGQLDDVATGIGDTARDALEDALEMIANTDIDVLTMSKLDAFCTTLHSKLKLDHVLEGRPEEFHEYVSIQWATKWETPADDGGDEAYERESDK